MKKAHWPSIGRSCRGAALPLALLLVFGSSCGPKAASTARWEDGDADGVPDVSDLCPSTPAELRVDAGGCPLALEADTLFQQLPGFGPADGPGPQGPALPSAGDTTPPPGYVRLEVFYGTDRMPTGKTEAREFFGTEAGELQLGSVMVSIPKRHAPGALEAPTVSCFGAGRDPTRHVALLEIRPLERPVWRERLRAAFESSREPEALVYIHGYRRSFEVSARRAAQLAFDLNFPGVPLLYSWPSKDDLEDYIADYQAVEETTLHLADFLQEVARNTGARRVHVIAHSLGNRALTNALEVIAADPESPAFSNIILSAPDVSARLFEEQIAPRIEGIAERLTLYASSPDKALQASERLRQSRRLGQAGETIVVLEGMDTIDASKVDTDWIGHGYIATNKQVIDDLFMLLIHGLSPADRNLEPQQKGELTYWALR